ncbi:universal stress protein [Zobellia alginiliquefaciens]|uniref:universal stress protein n=1 Tax=Zobellia alginiliquefaciens TaxID=3032586 RepID=UPI0023E440DF|nr:universal stress protein [Zobellia alginiliquefaciens]
MLKILLPTDFSENSRNAIDYALHFYKDVECVFYLLHAYTPVAYRVDYLLGSPAHVGLGDNWQSETETHINEFCSEIENLNKNEKHSFITHIALESLLVEVLKVTSREGIDIIVMGTQGATGAKSIFLGTRTMSVLKVSTCPVLVIPERCFYKKPAKLALATNYKRNFSADILAPVEQVLTRFSASMHIMHINEEKRLDSIQGSNRNTLDAYLKAFNPNYHWMPNFTSKTKSIQFFLKELDIDFLTMIKHDQDFFGSIMRESVIKKVSFCVEVPFLVVPVTD